MRAVHKNHNSALSNFELNALCSFYRYLSTRNFVGRCISLSSSALHKNITLHFICWVTDLCYFYAPEGWHIYLWTLLSDIFIIFSACVYCLRIWTPANVRKNLIWITLFTKNKSKIERFPIKRHFTLEMSQHVVNFLK